MGRVRCLKPLLVDLLALRLSRWNIHILCESALRLDFILFVARLVVHKLRWRVYHGLTQVIERLDDRACWTVAVIAAVHRRIQWNTCRGVNMLGKG